MVKGLLYGAFNAEGNIMNCLHDAEGFLNQAEVIINDFRTTQHVKLESGF
jgi:hypothetical protein